MDCTCRSHNGLLTAEGLAETAQRGQQLDAFPEVGLTRGPEDVILDIEGSVSGARRDETSFVFDDELLDNQYRRQYDGS